MPILYLRRSDGKVERVFAYEGTPLYNDYIAGGFSTTDPSAAPADTGQQTNTNIAPPTGTSNYPNYPTTQSGSNPLPVVSDPNQASGNYVREGIVTPALQVDAQYQKYFGRVGTFQEREYWIFRPIGEL